jgi:cobalamin biosynthesis Mg chelatase CobN
MKMNNLPDYIRAQLLLLIAILGSHPAKNAHDAIQILCNLFKRSPDWWSEERNEACERSIVVAEVYRTAVGGQNRTKELKYLMKKANKEFLKGVEETMKEGHQHDRGDMILDAHKRLFEVVQEEMEESIKPQVVMVTEQAKEQVKEQIELIKEQVEGR